jgi:transposase-like protein
VVVVAVSKHSQERSFERLKGAPRSDLPEHVQVRVRPERRRRWSAEQKMRIVDEMLEPGAVATQVAERHGISTGLLFTWRRQLRAAALPVSGWVRAGADCRRHARDEVRRSVSDRDQVAKRQAPACRIRCGSSAPACGAVGARSALMLLPGGLRVYLACGATDMRKGFDGLAALVLTVLRQDPYSGALFVFSWKARRPDQGAAVGSAGVGAVCQAARPRPVLLATGAGRCRVTDAGAVFHAGRGHRLAADGVDGAT